MAKINVDGIYLESYENFQIKLANGRTVDVLNEGFFCTKITIWTAGKTSAVTVVLEDENCQIETQGDIVIQPKVSKSTITEVGQICGNPGQDDGAF